MSTDNSTNGSEPGVDQAPQAPPRQLTEAAKRALAEAEERRAARRAADTQAKTEAELGGREGPDPVRYGDWENRGIISDF